MMALCEGDGGEENLRATFVSCRDTSPVLESAKNNLDLIPALVVVAVNLVGSAFVS